MSKKEDLKNIILNLVQERTVAYRVDFAKCFGGMHAGLFLSQLFYWSDKGKTDWIYKTQAEWLEEIGMTRYEQETARKRLKESEVIEEDFKGSPPKLHYRINYDIFISKLNSYYSTCGKPTSCDSTGGKAPGQHVEKPQVNKGKSSKSSITKNTTKNTNKDDNIPSRKKPDKIYPMVYEIFHVGYEKLTGKKFTTIKTKIEKNGKLIKDIIKLAKAEVGQDEGKIYLEIRERAAILYKLCETDSWYEGKFLPQMMISQWEKLVTAKKKSLMDKYDEVIK